MTFANFVLALVILIFSTAFVWDIVTFISKKKEQNGKVLEACQKSDQSAEVCTK